MDYGVLDFVRLHVERSAGIIGSLRLCSSDFWNSADNGSPSHRTGCHLQKRATIYQLRTFPRHFSLILAHSCVAHGSSFSVVCKTTGRSIARPVMPHQNPAKPCGLL